MIKLLRQIPSILIVLLIIILFSCNKDNPFTPILTTTFPSNITQTSAFSGGEITSDGGSAITSRGVCWSNSQNPTISDNKTSDGSGGGIYTSSITGLLLNTKYYIRAYATNKVGTAYGNELSFTTNPPTLPTLITITATSVTQISAFTGGSITGDGGSPITDRGVCWNTSPHPTTSNFKMSSGPGPGTFTGTITGLTINTKYYLRAYATNAAGTSYGNEINFTTNSALLPVVSTTEVSSVTQTSATSGGNITGDGGSPITGRGVCWNTTVNPTIDDNKTIDGSGPGTFSSLITGLSLNTTFYIKAYATNSAGTAYGDELSFTTDPATLPVLSTAAISAITQTSATGGGEITGDGGAPITLRGLCWSVNHNPTTADNKTTEGSGPGAFSGFITGLTLNTTYYVRAYAINIAGTAYGNEVSFTTDPATLPVLTTSSVTAVTQTSAASGGNITGTGGAGITSRGVCWSTSPNPTINDYKTNDGNGAGAFSSALTGLVLNTTYYVRAFATNVAGTGYGNEVSFTTNPATLPILSTAPVSSITQTSATTGGNITGNGGAVITSRGVCWGTTPNPAINGNKTNDGSGPGTFSSLLTGLVLNTTYYVRAYATNVAGTAYGNELSFTTDPAGFATITTTAITSVTQTSAATGGTVTGDGGVPITGRGVCWSTNHNPTTNNYKTSDGSGPGTFSSVLTGLNLSTTYYVRAYAINSAGTAYGNELSFTTNAANLPTLSTTQITSVTQTSAASGGNITGDGGAPINVRGVCWSTSSNPTTDDYKTTDGSGPGTYSSALTGLLLNTTYYVRAYATNNAGTSYGDELSFTTDPATLPILSTAAITSITQTSAFSGGDITGTGGAAIIVRGVCWKTSASPTIADNKTTDGSGPGTFSSFLSGLTLNTKYYVRAYATNAAGTSYGNEISFTTDPATLPSLTTSAITSITQNTANSGGNITGTGGASIIARGVCWSTSPNPSLSDNKTSNGSGPGTFSSFISGLTLNTKYYVRAYATNVSGTAYGNELNFTTDPATLPVLTTLAATTITKTSAFSGGNITGDGGAPITARGICWSTLPGPTLSDNKVDNGSGPGTFSSYISGLIAGTKYYVRAFATNAAGTSYGNEINFTTEAATLASLTTTAITSITQTSASTGGTITGDGGAPITFRGVCWNTSPNPTTDNSGTINGSGPGSFTSFMSGLLLNTTYYVRAYAINSAGTAYGNELTFTTNPATLPVLTTANITSIMQTSAASGGTITGDGGVPIIARGICWSTSPNPTTANSGTTDGAGPGAFTSILTGLLPGTTYYVRAYATNSAGTGYGNELSFTTNP